MKTLGAPTAGQDMDSNIRPIVFSLVLGLFDVLQIIQHRVFGLDDVIARLPLVTLFSGFLSHRHGGAPAELHPDRILLIKKKEIFHV